MVYANQQGYYDAINRSTDATDSGIFIDFMLEEIYKTLKKRQGDPLPEEGRYPEQIPHNWELHASVVEYRYDQEDDQNTQETEVITQEKPKYTQENLDFTQEMAGITQEEDTIAQENTQEKILAAIRENPKITRRELAVLLERTEDSIKYQLLKLTRRGIIKHVGATKAGEWTILNESR